MTLEFTSIISAAIAAIGSVILGFINKGKVEQVHVLVNSQLTAVKADLAVALLRTEKLETLLLQITKPNGKPLVDINKNMK